jgi:DNA polymerase-1
MSDAGWDALEPALTGQHSTGRRGNDQGTLNGQRSAGAQGAADGAASANAAAASLFDTASLFEVDSLFDAEPTTAAMSGLASLDVEAEWAAQQAAITASTDPGRLRFLCAAESAAALAAAEMHHAGLPWRSDIHDALLTDRLGPRPPVGQRPERMEALAQQIRAALDAPRLNPDSHQELLKAMQYAGTGAHSLRQWEIRDIKHPVIAPLLEYKKLSRLLTANGWNWCDTWVRGGRFRPDYVVGGVVTGRWSATGGGALQLPKQVRSAVVADPGWVLVCADVAQLEPRVLAAMSGDQAMAAAGRGVDMYAGIVDAGVVASRDQAKYGMLGAMYGGTQGVSGQVRPAFARAFPRAIALVDGAAAAGEGGEVVRTWLGRGSPRPHPDQMASNTAVRAWGRFTRNFVVQGTGAEWANMWLAGIRRRLWDMGETDDGPSGLAPHPFTRRPHLVFMVHDEVVIHSPAGMAEAVADGVRAAASEAGRLLFGPASGVEFPLTIATVPTYAQAK